MRTNEQRVWQHSQVNKDGFTLSLESFKQPTAGICVAYKATQGSHSRESLERVIEHAEKHDKFVGGWTDETTGLTYFDSVKVFSEFDLEEATAFAHENEQLAIYILSTNTEIRF